MSIFIEIFDSLISNSTPYNLDEKLSDQSKGPRWLRGPRDNIFSISAIINSIINDGHSPVQIQLYDIVKCSDKIWLHSISNTVYDNGLQDSMLNIFYEVNKNAKVALKFNDTITRRINIPDRIMQITLFSAFMCASSMDRII